MAYNKIFVYGTLRKGRIEIVMPSVAKHIKVVGKGFVAGKLFNAGEYPAAIASKDGKVYGEVIEIEKGKEKDVLRLMDDYEEFDESDVKASLFIRDTTEVIIEKGQKISTWIYWYNNEVNGLRLIKDGVYRSRKLTNSNE